MMKKKLTIWHLMLAAATVITAASITSCASEYEDAHGSREPLTFTAKGLGEPETGGWESTRATIDGQWTDGMKVAVKVGSEVKRYVARTTDGINATISADTDVDPFYWDISGICANKMVVKAWLWHDGTYHSDEPTIDNITVSEDQSTHESYQACDILKNGFTVLKSNPYFTFRHLPAKVSVVLTAGDGVQESDLAQAKVTFSIPQGGEMKSIKMYNDGTKHLALVAPVYDVKPKVSIVCGGRVYEYTHSSDQKFADNQQYLFKLKLSRNAVTLEGISIRQWDEKTLAGDGTEATEITDDYRTDANGVYHVFTADGLKAWAQAIQDNSKYDISCTLENDITLPTVADGESNWTAIGSAANKYTGTFDGNGHTISGLTINNPAGHQGLFAYMDKGTVKGLTMKELNVKSNDNGFTGGICGEATNGSSFTNCSVSGTVTGPTTGLAYQNQKKCVGGICGIAKNSSFTDCHFSGTVEAGGAVGGICGDVSNCPITACHASGTVLGNDYTVGGICGGAGNSPITACYVADMEIKNNSERAGGIVGSVFNTNTITSCYALCTVTGSSYAGGICGLIDGGTTTFKACYWKADNDENKPSNGIGGGWGKNNGTPTKVEGSDWSNALSTMNNNLPNSSTFKYAVNPDAATRDRHPLVLVPAD